MAYLHAMIHDVAIIGAGPAGSTCALGLRDAGLRVALLDKAIFPRDKVCGDAIPALCGRVLQQIDPALRKALDAFTSKVSTATCRVVAPAGHHFEYRFQTSGWCSPRLDFDQFLLGHAREVAGLDFFPGHGVKSILGGPGNWELITEQGSVHAKVLVGADGANGLCASRLSGQQMSPDHHCAAVRAYYSNVGDLVDDRMEIHLLERYLPGYFWIFPVGNGLANVGFGMMRNDIAKQKLSLRQLLPELLAQSPGLAPRFAHAVAHSLVQGFGLPLGARKVPLSGEGFLLCGDAGCLIEPATGEGIGNAMYSGHIAALTLKRAFSQNRFDADFFQSHDQQVYAKLWKGMRQKHLAQQVLGGRKAILNTLIGLAGRPGPVQWLMRKVF